MGGWARRQLTVVPNGDVLPCPTAHALPLPRASVRCRRPTRWRGRVRRSLRRGHIHGTRCVSAGNGYVAPIRFSCPPHSRSRSTNFCTLPVEVFGNGANSMASGHL